MEISQRGYSFNKDHNQIAEIKKDLTIRPFIKGSPIQLNTTYPVYRESSKKIYVPRIYGISKFGEPDTYKFKNIEQINISFNGNLRECQVNATDAYLENVCEETGGCGLIEKGCGKGKTVDGLFIIHKLKVKTLIIVHKEFLLNQWIDRINQYLPTAKIGKIQGQNIDIDGKDIVIGMLQSISMKDYPPQTFSSFGLTIVDEVHHISSEIGRAHV